MPRERKQCVQFLKSASKYIVRSLTCTLQYYITLEHSSEIRNWFLLLDQAGGIHFTMYFKPVGYGRSIFTPLSSKYFKKCLWNCCESKITK